MDVDEEGVSGDGSWMGKKGNDGCDSFWVVGT